jgi:hypothetical protein
MRAARYWMFDVGYSMLGAGYWSLVAEIVTSESDFLMR